MPIDTVIFDLDGVLRDPIHPEKTETIERSWGIATGSIGRHARSSELIEALTLGRITRNEWLYQVGLRIGSIGAAREWGQVPLQPNCAVIELVRDLRRAGANVSCLTNGTDTVADEMAALGVGGLFDQVLNSAELGLRKPDPQIYRRTLAELSITGEQALLVDDSPANVEGARSVGMYALLFQGVNALRRELLQRGLTS